MYKKRTWKAGDYLVVRKNHSGRYPKGNRRPKANPTAETVQRQNEKQRAERLQLLIMANFVPGDLFVDLTYTRDTRPEDMAEAKKELAKFMRKLRAWAQKKGQELKWIAATERGSRGGCHHHLLVNHIPGISQAISELWEKGHAKLQHLYADGAYEQLAEYIGKASTKEEAFGTRYTRSRNLIVPPEKVEIVKASTFAEEPKAPAGYVLLKDTITNGINPATGYPYQRYVCRRAKE